MFLGCGQAVRQRVLIPSFGGSILPPQNREYYENERPLMIFSGNSNRRLAEDVANYLNISVGKASVTTFSDGKFQLKFRKT